MNKLISPYKNLVQFTKIQLQPYQLNSDIELNMETVLKQKVEDKCNKYGFIDKVYNIQKYSNGILKRENLSGCIDYDITYECKICLPIEDTVIICRLAAINQELIMGTNGPIVVFIPKTNIESNIWNISSTFTHKKTNKELQKDTLVKVLINKVKINQNDKQIKCIGTLLEEPNQEEIDAYYYSNIDTSNDIINSDNFII